MGKHHLLGAHPQQLRNIQSTFEGLYIVSGHACWQRTASAAQENLLELFASVRQVSLCERNQPSGSSVA
jgi:hypothetical protein